MARPTIEAQPLDGIEPLTGTADIGEVKVFLASVSAGLIAGRIPPGMARELGQLASKQITAIRTEASLHEMDELRELVARYEAALTEHKRLQVEARQRAGGDVQRGKWTDEET